MNISSPQELKNTLHAALGSALGNLAECALLDYPDYLNIGDRLIWLGTVFYLTDVLQAKIKYIASIKSFNAAEMERQIGSAPILLQGGGNFGDTWPIHQQFRETIVSKYRDRPIFILPQSLHFTQAAALQQAADIFNSHPNLTLFIRDNYSYEVAAKAFTNCRLIKAPDMALQMVNMPGINLKVKQRQAILYHCRQDAELNPAFAASAIHRKDLVVRDWVSSEWIYREKIANADAWYWQLPGMVRLVREGWQRGLATPQEWLSRQQWMQHPWYQKLKSLPHPAWQQDTWSLMHAGIYQFQPYRLVITNRLHGHILCLLLGIPHLFLPNSYHKNEAFYQTWSSGIPSCRFAKAPEEIKAAIQELGI